MKKAQMAQIVTETLPFLPKKYTYFVNNTVKTSD